AVADPTRDRDDSEPHQPSRLDDRLQVADVIGQVVAGVRDVTWASPSQIGDHHPAWGQRPDQPGVLRGQLAESGHDQHPALGGAVSAALEEMQPYAAVRRPSAAYGLMGYRCGPHERFGSRGSLSSRSAMTLRPISEVPPAMLRHRSKRYSKTISGSPSLTAASPAIRSPSSETR